MGKLLKSFNFDLFFLFLFLFLFLFPFFSFARIIDQLERRLWKLNKSLFRKYDAMFICADGRVTVREIDTQTHTKKAVPCVISHHSVIPTLITVIAWRSRIPRPPRFLFGKLATRPLRYVSECVR